MKIRPEQVAKVARLARLDLDEPTLELYAGQLAEVLEHMDKLGEVDTEGVEPLYSPVEHVSVMREDVESREHGRDEVLSNAPESDGQAFIVPRIV